jgi:elongator complex protein 3
VVQKAFRARIAAGMMEKSGRLPPFSPKKRSFARGRARRAAKEAAEALLADPNQSLERLKNRLALAHKSSYLKNSEILAFVPRNKAALRRMLLKSPTRTLSGVSPLALMPPPFPCPGKCIYCPKGENAPQSYTGYEPTTMRAIQCGYSAARQVNARLSQYAAQGHALGKCHLIIMGGTFLCAPREKKEAFVKDAFEALNGRKSKTLRQAIDENELARHRAIGVTFETRPDFGMERQADEMLSMGGTQVELGVQSLSDEVYRRVLRGHTVEDVVRSTAILKDCGFKVCYHMMPGLFSTPRQDAKYFRLLFSDPRFQPDMVKIYPVLVMRGTRLYSMWKKGEFEPYTTEQAAKVIADAARFVPPYVRVPRIQRDIPSPLVAAGVKNSNLRQIVDKLLSERGERCRCIRCREIGSAERRGGCAIRLKLKMRRLEYAASGGKEVFLSMEDTKHDLLAGFLRLRRPIHPHRRELAGASVVRELHVYGAEAEIGERAGGKAQHHGIGKKLLEEAERITREEWGMERICVLSGPGARGYYRKLGYSKDGPYMQKKP